MNKWINDKFDEHEFAVALKHFTFKKEKLCFLLQVTEIQKERNKLQSFNQGECEKAMLVSMIQM